MNLISDGTTTIPGAQPNPGGQGPDAPSAGSSTPLYDSIGMEKSIPQPPTPAPPPPPPQGGQQGGPPGPVPPPGPPTPPAPVKKQTHASWAFQFNLDQPSMRVSVKVADESIVFPLTKADITALQTWIGTYATKIPDPSPPQAGGSTF